MKDSWLSFKKKTGCFFSEYKISILVAVFTFLLIGTVSAFSDTMRVNIQTEDGGTILPNQAFLFNFSITSNPDCTGILYNTSTSMTTDSRGIVSYQLQNISMEFNDSLTYFCYFRDNVLKLNTSFSFVAYAGYAKNVSWSGVVNRPVNLSQFINDIFNSSDSFITTGNITADTGFFNLAWSWLTNIPNLIYGLWTENNVNNLLISNGTLIGYNQTIFNSSVDTRVNIIILANNESWTSTYNSTYAEYTYNQTIPANAYTDSVVSANNNSWSSTYNATYDTKNSSQWVSSGNDIYNRNNGTVNITGNLDVKGNITTEIIEDPSSNSYITFKNGKIVIVLKR